MRRGDVLQAADQPIGAARIFLLPARKHRLHFTALHVVLRAAQLARNDRELAAARVSRDVALRAVRERTDDDVLAVITLELRRHRLQARAEEYVQEQRLHDVVAVMAERDL